MKFVLISPFPHFLWEFETLLMKKLKKPQQQQQQKTTNRQYKINLQIFIKISRWRKMLHLF